MAIHEVKGFHESFGDFKVRYDDDVAHQFRYELRLATGESYWYRYDEFWRELLDGPRTTVDREHPVFTDTSALLRYSEGNYIGDEGDVDEIVSQNIAITAALDELRKL